MQSPVRIALVIGTCGALAACGGAGSTDRPDAHVAPGPVVTVVEGAPRPADQDRDRDGLPDHLDAKPGVPIQVMHDAGVLALNAAGMAVDGQLYSGTHLAGRPLQLHATGSQLLSGDVQVLLRGVDEVRLERRFERTPEGLAVAAAHLPSGLRSVALIDGDAISRSLAIQSWPAGTPLLAPDVDGLHALAGGELRVRGVNLDGASARLDGVVLRGLASTPTRAVFAVPDNATAGLVTLARGALEGPAYRVRMHAPVQVRFSARVARAHATLWRNDRLGLRSLPTSATATVAALQVPAGRLPPVIDFAPEPSGIRAPQARAVAWPGEQDVLVSARSMAEAAILDWALHVLPAHLPSPAVLRAHMDAYLASDAGLVLQDMFLAGLSDPAQFDRSAIRPHVLQTFPAVAAKGGPAPVQQNTVDIPSEIYGYRFLVDGVEGLVPQRYYDNFAVGFKDTETCTRRDPLFGVPIPPPDVWPSSLCVENDNFGVASVEVRIVTPDGTQSPAQDHVNPADGGMFNTNIIGGNRAQLLNLANVSFLKSGDGTGLCRMQSCRIELLSGTFGEPARPLSKSEREVVEVLRQRLVFDRAIFPAINKLVGGLIDESRTGCVGKVLAQSPGFVVSFKSFSDKVAADPSNKAVFEAFRDDIVYGFILGLPRTELLSDLAASGCLGTAAQQAKKQIEQRLKAVIENAGGSAELIKQAVELFDAGIKTREVLTTPAQFAFTAQPRSQIATVIGGGVPGDPEALDRSSADANLFIGGSLLAQKRDGDDDIGIEFYPRVQISDRDNNFVQHRVRPEHVRNSGSISIPIRELLAPAPQTPKQGVGRQQATAGNSVRLGGLKPGPIEVSIIHDWNRFDGFPDDVVPVPGQRINLVDDPLAEGFRDPAVRGGGLVRIQGYRLADLQDRLSHIRLLALGGASSDLDRRIDVFSFDRVGGVTRDLMTEIRFDAPDDLGTIDTVTYAAVLNFSDGSAPLSVDGALQVRQTGNFGEILLSDPGPARGDSDTGTDDTMSIALLSAEDTEVEIDAIYDGPNAGGVLSITWRDADLVSPPASSIELACEDPGEDDYCTYLLTVRYNGEEATFSGRFQRDANGDDIVDLLTIELVSRGGAGAQDQPATGMR